jgi:hypothetical protein
MARSGDEFPDRTKRQRNHGYFPAPENLPGFPEAQRVKRKGGRTRWKDDRGRIYEWDSRHGAIELYDAFGRHLGEYDHMTGDHLKRADVSRRIEP